MNKLINVNNYDFLNGNVAEKNRNYNVFQMP